MAANRTTYNSTDNPGGFTGTAFADDVADEIKALWNYVITPVGTIGGTANAITGVCTPVLLASYADRQQFEFVPTAGNTGAVTVNWDGKGAKALKAPDGTALVSGDLVSGVPVRMLYDATAGYMRMSQWSMRAQSAAAQSGYSTYWELFGDTTVGSAVAQVEHLFTANRYSKVLQIASGIQSAGGQTDVVSTLRNSSAAVVTTNLGGSPWPGSTGLSNSDIYTVQTEFLIDIVTAGATKSHFGEMKGGGYSGALSADGVLRSNSASGRTATAPDRVRWAFTGSNTAAGRIMSYGLKA